jgi:hypothetical protein
MKRGDPSGPDQGPWAPRVNPFGTLTCRSIYQRMEFSVATALACGMSEKLVYSK